jgi:hypothetical protein
MGPGGTLGLKHGVSRIDDLTTREFASCCGVNLAGCIRVLWFVVWVFGLGGSARVVASRWGPGPAERSKCQLLGTAHCRDLSLARLPSHPHPGTAPFSSPSVGRTAHAGQQGRRFPPHHANRRRAGDPGAGDPWLRANSYSPPEGRGFYRWLLASLGPSARCGGLPGGLPLLPPPGNNDMSDRKPVLGDLRGGAGSFSRGKGRNCRSFFLGETE